jgi:hypothetical protein
MNVDATSLQAVLFATKITTAQKFVLDSDRICVNPCIYLSQAHSSQCKKTARQSKNILRTFLRFGCESSTDMLRCHFSLEQDCQAHSPT